MAKASEYEPEFAPLDKLLLEGAGFFNPRVTFDKKEIESLADSIEERKLQVPLLVWVADEHGEPIKDESGAPIKVILSGKRRRAALELLVEGKRANGYEKAVPYYPFTGNLQQARITAIVENTDRENVTDYDTAASIQGLVDLGLQQKDIAKALHKSNAWVSRVYAAYRNCCEPVRKAWQSGKISKEAAQNIATFVVKGKKGEGDVPDFKKQEAALKEFTEARAGGKKARGKARSQAKRDAGKKADRLSNGLLADYISELEYVKKDKGYLHGMLDGLRLAAGLIGEDKLAPPYRGHKNAILKAQAAEAKAKGEETDDE
jgi:ParB/RepB/Spo0J family partition protein